MKNTKRNDWILIAVIFIIVLVLWVLLKQSQGQNMGTGTAVVTIDGTVYKEYQMDQEITEKITLPDGSYNILEIKNGEADITQASCPDRYCVNHRKISKNKESIICLPNKVIVTIENGEESDVDSVTN